VLAGVGVGVAVAADKDTFTDNDFIAKALDAGVAEVKLGQLAERLGNSDKVREFGRLMVKDHTAANKELMELASARKLGVVTDMKKQALSIYNRMSKLDKAEFDRSYAKQMVDDHKKAVKLFERATKDATDANVKKFAEKTLPTLKEHLKKAQALNKDLGK
jgi:putative membrane protein